MSLSLEFEQITFKRPTCFLSNLQNMYLTKKHVDVTFRVEGQLIEAHRLVLCASSPYFDELFTKYQLNGTKVITLVKFKFQELKTLIKYMYWGEVTVPRESVPSLMTTAAALQMTLMEDTLRTDGPSPGKSENIFIPNLISDQSISVDYDLIPPNSMTTPEVHVADIIVHQEVEKNVGGLMEEREPLDDDNPEGELNLTDEDFSLHLSEDEESLVPHVEELSAADGAETERLGAKRKSYCKTPSSAEENRDEENQDIENGNSIWVDSSEEEAYPVSSSPRRSQPKRDVGTNQKGAKGTKRSVSNKSSHLAAESNEEPNRDEENQKGTEDEDSSPKDDNSISTDDSSVDKLTAVKPRKSLRLAAVQAKPVYDEIEGESDVEYFSTEESGGSSKVDSSSDSDSDQLDEAGPSTRRKRNFIIKDRSSSPSASNGAPAIKKPYKCYKCGSSYKREQSYKQHKEFSCGKQKKLSCPQCEYFRTHSKYNFQKHLLRIHKVDRSQWSKFGVGCVDRPTTPFKCVPCRRTYKSKDSLNEHLKYSCKKNPSFSCSLCEYSATKNGNLRRHLVNVHGVDPSNFETYGADQLQCNICPFRGLNGLALKKHKRVEHNDGKI